jgi:hypothetical protein
LGFGGIDMRVEIARPGQRVLFKGLRLAVKRINS